GSFGSALFQVGANVGETIGLNLATSMRQSAIGAIASAASSDLDAIITEGTDAVAGAYTTGQLNSLDFSTDAVAFVGGDAATTVGVSVTDYQAGAAVTFDVDGIGINLNADYTNLAGVTAEIQADLDVANSGEYVVSDDGVDITITKTATATDPTIAVVIDNGTGTTAAEFTGATGNAGVAAVVTSNLEFDVDGTTVTINSDYSGDLAGLVADIQTQAGASYVVAADSAAGFSVTSAAAGATPATVVDNFQTTSITGASGGTAVTAADAVVGSTVTVSADFSIQIGTGTAAAVADGVYTTAQSLVDAINTALGGNATATLNDDGTFNIDAAETITVTGNTGLTTLGLAASTTASGSLTGASVLTVSSSNTMIQRLDSALTSVNDLRSTFGAIQNRFESTIASIQTTSENLSASRSRILDTDFAAETANLTRAQILQQAGTAMLAQANALPQNVLALLQ
ncbi:MAG: flagellin, partial [Porticoccus sp.]|nr:flagellin [Porticoccus sp.]